MTIRCRTWICPTATRSRSSSQDSHAADPLIRVTCHRIETRTRDASTSSGSDKPPYHALPLDVMHPPPQSLSCPVFPLDPGFGPRPAPPPQLRFVTSGRTEPFQQSVHRFRPKGADLRLVQLAHDPYDVSPTKLNLVYTPRTSPTPSIFEDPGGDTPGVLPPRRGQGLNTGWPVM